MLQVQRSLFAKGGWGLTYYANKTREALVLLASGTMNTCLEIGEYEWAIKLIKLLISINSPLTFSKRLFCLPLLIQLVTSTYD